MKFNSLNIKYLAFAVIVGIGLFSFGIYVGSTNGPEIEKVTSLTGKATAVETTTDFSPFWKAWNLLNEKYPDAKKVTDQEKLYGAIKGLVGSMGDPYTVFYTPDESKSFEEDIAGNFSGIGMEVGMKDDAITVIAPLKNTPAERAGIQTGDKVLKIGDTDTAGMSVDEAVKMIRGPKGTSVTLTILRGASAPKEVKITRDIINVPVLDTEILPGNIFVIHLYSFSANSSQLFGQALKEFQAKKTDKLILDLRGNPGGYLDSAVEMSSWFLPAGKVIVTEDYGNNLDKKDYRSRGYDAFTDKLKFVILINGGSASASEILAGAMQDYGKALLVGEKSFGKGSVQEVVKVTNDTLLKVTVAKWLTPKGKSISGAGLAPDYTIPFTAADKELKKDPQMDKAVDLLKNWPKK